MKFDTKFCFSVFPLGFFGALLVLLGRPSLCVNGAVGALQLDSLGRVVFVGSDRTEESNLGIAARLTTGGVIDTSFSTGTSGVLRHMVHPNSVFSDVEILPGDEMLAIGSATPDPFRRTLHLRSSSGSFTSAIDSVLSVGHAIARVTGITGLAIGGQSRFAGGIGAFVGLVNPDDLSFITKEVFKPLGLKNPIVRDVINDHSAPNQLYVAGTTFNGFAKRAFLARFERTGVALQLNPGFGAGGFVFSDPSDQVDYTRVSQDSTGNLIVLGALNGNVIVEKWDSTGTLINAFGQNGRFTASPGLNLTAHGLACQADDKVVIAGTSRFNGQRLAVLRTEADGTLDTAFGINGMYTFDFDAASFANDLVLDGAGNMFVGGGIGLKTLVVKINPSGFLVNSFGFQGVFSEFFDSVVPSTVILQHETTSGMPGGPFGVSVITRSLNAINPAGGTSRVQLGGGGSFILQPGTYTIMARAAAADVGGHQVELFNVSNGLVEAVGTSEDSTGASRNSISELAHTVTILASTTYELRHRAALPNILPIAQGLAAGLGNTEVHARVVVSPA